MARKRRSVQYVPAPPQVPRGRVGPTRTGTATSQVEVESQTQAALAALYGHVRRDLARIFVLAIAMFTLIYASTLVFK